MQSSVLSASCPRHALGHDGCNPAFFLPLVPATWWGTVDAIQHSVCLLSLPCGGAQWMQSSVLSASCPCHVVGHDGCNPAFSLPLVPATWWGTVDAIQYSLCMLSCCGALWMQKLRSPLLRVQRAVKGSLFKHWVDQNTA